MRVNEGKGKRKSRQNGEQGTNKIKVKREKKVKVKRLKNTTSPKGTLEGKNEKRK